MLQKKLLARLGLLVVGFVLGAVVSITFLQSLLSELNTASANAESILGHVQTIASRATVLENRLGEPEARAAQRSAADEVLDSFSALRSHPFIGSDSELTASVTTAEGKAVALLEALRSADGPSPTHLAAARSLCADIAAIGIVARRHITAEQSTLSWHLRSLIIGLTIAALIMTNIAIIVLIRTANMILKPVGQLIQGSRELASEHFDHRIRLAQNGEFAELATAYNTLADQLASNEQKKVKALQHLAVTLNHELNNVINGIELQLTLLNRRSGGDPQLSSYLANIHTHLARIAQTIASLRNVRRVVLTDYMPGEPMVDLGRSIAVEDLAVSVRNAPLPRPADRADQQLESPR